MPQVGAQWAYPSKNYANKAGQGLRAQRNFVLAFIGNLVQIALRVYIPALQDFCIGASLTFLF
jgi:hypothetical protein